jgi:hypothetical protein
MGSIKRKCTGCNCVHLTHRLCKAYAPWEVHPSWKIAMCSLDAYSHWVSEVVVPIAFEWIEEHKKEVYANIPPKYQEDVGVVMSAAFELVSKGANYTRGLEYGKQIEEEQKTGAFDSTQFNPVWTDIAKQIHHDVEQAFAKYKDVLKHSGEK